LAITVHYIDEEWNFVSSLLSFVSFQDSHSGVGICEKFLESVSTEFGVHCKLLAVTTDNASSNRTFIENLQTSIFFNPEYHVRCFAHVLNIAVKSAISNEEVDRMIKALRFWVKRIRVSPQRLRRLQQLCEACSPPISFVKPVIDVSTRWNSTLDMIERSLRLKPALNMFILEDNDARKDYSIQELGPRQWGFFENLSKFLKPFKDVTTFCSSSSYPTLSVVVPLYNSLMDHCESWKASTKFQSCFCDAVELCLSKLAEYYNLTSHVFSICTLIDPRLKLEYYKNSHAFGHENPEKLTEHLNNIYEIQYLKCSKIVTEDDSISSNDENFIRNVFKKRKLKNVEEVALYLSEPVIDLSDDPLLWWKNNQHKYPNLSRLARDFLAIPASSVPSECAFSSGRRLVSDFRCSLASETFPKQFA
jgi:hypothetical protein